MIIQNTTGINLTLPNGIRINAGASMTVDNATWDEFALDSTVSSWIIGGYLVEIAETEDPGEAPLSGTDPVRVGAKFVMLDDIAAFFGGGSGGSTPYYNVATIAPVSGTLTIDFAIAQTFLINMTGNVTTIAFENIPVGKSQTVALYFKQDATGTRTLTGWPSPGTISKAPNEVYPSLSTAPLSIDLVTVNAFGGFIFGTLVARNYK